MKIFAYAANRFHEMTDYLMKNFKDIAYIIFGLVCLCGTLYLIYIPVSGIQMTAKEQALSSTLQFVITTLLSLIFSYFFAKSGVFEKNDPIAEASTEKIVNLSIQIDRLKEFLLSSIEAVESQPASAEMQLSGLKHRVESAAEMSVLLALSNQTFKNDWLGVVSPAMRNKIQQKYKQTSEWISETDKKQKLEKKLEASSGNDALVSEISAQLRETESKIERLSDSIPTATAPIKKIPAVAVNSQTFSEASPTKQLGELSISVLRSVPIATGSGRLDPHMASVPNIKVELKSAPTGFDKDKYKCSPGTGTNYDFNISIKSQESGTPVPVGDYVFSFSAEVTG